MQTVYLACPYSSPDPETKHYRYLEANKAAARLMKAGYRVFSPISHSHPIDTLGEQELPDTFDFWVEQQDKYWLERCDVLVVLWLARWEESSGIKAEIATATLLDIPIWYMNQSGDLYTPKRIGD